MAFPFLGENGRRLFLKALKIVKLLRILRPSSQSFRDQWKMTPSGNISCTYSRIVLIK
jgi:hypothetical protein